MDGGADFDWDDLRYFLHAAQAQTLAGAARALGVKHSTVGRRISSLERALGAALVLRRPDGLHLTDLGHALVPLAREVDRAVLAARNVVAAQKVRVRLAVPSGFTRMFTPGLAELRKACPDLALEILGSSKPVDLEKDEADLALRHGPITALDLVVRKVAVSGWSLYASKAYLARHARPLDIDDLSGHELIGYDRSLAGMPAAQWLEARTGTATVVLRSREMTDMLGAASAGVGLAALPCWLADEDPQLVRLTTAVIASRQLSLVYRREARLSQEVRSVIGFVVSVIRAHADRIEGRSGAGDVIRSRRAK